MPKAKKKRAQNGSSDFGFTEGKSYSSGEVSVPTTASTRKYEMVKSIIFHVVDKVTAKKIKDDPLDKADFKDANDLYIKAQSLESQKQWSEMYSLLETSLELIRRVYNEKLPLPWVTHELAIQVKCLVMMDKYEEAIKKFQYMSKLWENIDDQNMKSSPYFNHSFKLAHNHLSLMFHNLKYLDEELEVYEWIAEHVTGLNSKEDQKILSCSQFSKVAINYELGNYEKAILEMNNFKKAKAIDATDCTFVGAQIRNAMALEKLGQYSNALDALADVPDGPDDYKKFLCQGNCLARLGDF